MGIGPFQPGELFLIFVVILLLLGPKKLPELARGLGQAIREFRKAAQGIEEPAPPRQQVQQEAPRESTVEPVKVVEQDVRRK